MRGRYEADKSYHPIDESLFTDIPAIGDRNDEPLQPLPDFEDDDPAFDEPQEERIPASADEAPAPTAVMAPAPAERIETPRPSGRQPSAEQTAAAVAVIHTKELHPEKATAKPRTSKVKVAVIVVLVLLVVAAAVAFYFVQYAQKTYNVPLSDEQVSADMNALDFADARYGDENFTPTDGYTLTSATVGEPTDLIAKASDASSTITHEGAGKSVTAQCVISNGYYDVALPVTVEYRFHNGEWGIESTTRGDGVVTPVVGIDVAKLNWANVGPAVYARWSVVQQLYTAPTLSFDDQQTPTGGTVNMHMSQPISGTFSEYRADVGLVTSFDGAKWNITATFITDDYGTPAFDGVLGTWTGAWQQTAVSEGGTPCNGASGSSPVLNITAYDPATKTFTATLSFVTHRHGMRLTGAGTAADPYTIYTMDDDAQIDVPFSRFTLNADNSFVAGYYPSNAYPNDMVKISGTLTAEGTGTLTITVNYATDDERNVYTGIYDDTGKLVSSVPAYTDTYTLTKTA